MNKNLLFTIIILLLFGCESMFEFSPYQANVKDKYKGQNAKALGNIYLQDGQINRDTIVFVTIADSHDYFADLKDAISKINSLDGIDFAVHLGDLADKGLLKQYEIYSNIVDDINKPLVTCIGNHDYLSNGGEIYSQMFGDFNFSYIYKGVHFIVFDGTRFESNKAADLDWLEQELASNQLPKIIFSHIAPWCEDYRDFETKKFESLIEQEPVILLCHGHQHSYFYGTLLNAEVQHLIPGAIYHRKIGKIEIYPDNTYDFELIPF